MFYQTDEEGIFIGEVEGVWSPVDEVFLAPKGAIVTAPPFTELPNKAKYVNNEWITVVDHRGKTYWLDYEKFTMTELGSLPEGAVTEDPGPKPLSLEEERQLMKLTFAQLLIGLVEETWITEAEGEQWLQGILPDAVLTVIDTLPLSQQFAAKARAISPSVILRNDSFVTALGASELKTPEELDTFFTTYMSV
jgi:hypothetical protein